MATGQGSGVIHDLRRAMLLRDGAGLTDEQLLRDYVSRRDQAAFAAIVQRHAPMVWGVCRRVLGNYHDAEDAFQAAFLVLVRRAASIASPALLANWLYGVAQQTAMKARVTIAKRKAREQQVADMPEPAVVEQDLWNDLQSLLDQELSRLPDFYRVVIVLCDLEGKTRKETARQLDLPEGTVGSRLARARVMLAKRLARRGLAISGVALAALLLQNAASAGVPASVVSSTISAASLFAAGSAAAAGAISSEVAALTEGVLKAMLISKLKAIVAVVLVLGFIVTGGAVLSSRTAAAQSDKGKAPQKQEQKQDRPKGDKDLSALEGRWDLVSEEHDGVKRELMFKSYQFIFKGKEVTTAWVRDDDSAGGGANQFVINATRNPKELTISGDNLKILAVYKVEKDRLTIAHFGKPEDARPKGFTVADAAGEGRILVVRVLKRVPEPKRGKTAPEGRPGRKERPTTPQKQAQKQEKEAFTAWGKEVGGLQAGLGFRPGEQRAYRHGETVKLVVRVRNVGKEKVTFQYVSQFLIEIPPAVTDGKGKLVPAGLRSLFGVHLPKEVTLPPGKEIELFGELEVRPDFGTGKVSVQYERVFGNSSSGQIKLDPNLSKLATGKLELEIKSEPPAATEKKAPQKQEKEPFTAWGKEVGGLQAGLGYQLGQKRAYHHGETATVVLRIRNVSKKEVEFVCCRQYFMEESPSMTNGQGKPVRLPSNAGTPKPRQEKVGLAPGKEIVLYELKFKLRPESKNEDDDNDRESEDFAGRVYIFYGTGRFQIQYKRLIDKPWAGTEPDPILRRLATGKLELEVKDAKKLPEKKEKKTFTAWGKEINGLQAGLGLRPGGHRAYHHGESVALVVRVKNVGKETVKFEYIRQFLDEEPPTVTRADGKTVPQVRLSVLGEHGPVAVTLEPGKEVELESRMAGGAKRAGAPFIRCGLGPALGTGKVSFQYERVLGNSSAWSIKIDPALSKLATGKLELEIKSAPPPAAPKEEPEAGERGRTGAAKDQTSDFRCASTDSARASRW